MFRNKTTLILIFFGAWLNCFSQYTAPLPKWAYIEDITGIDKVDLKKVKDGYYYILASEQYNYVAGQRFFHYSTKVVTETGLDVASQLEINFDPSYEKAYFHFIRIHRNGEVIDKTKSADYKTLNEEKERGKGILNGRKTYFRNMDDLRKGDIIEYAYSITGTNPLFKNDVDVHFYFSYSVPVGKLIYRLIVKDPSAIQIRNSYTPIVEPERRKLADGNELVWTVNNPIITTLEENTPAWYDPYPQTHVSSFSDWNTVKKWCTSLFVLKKENKLLDDLVKGITDKYPDDQASQITALVDFCQNEVRYSGNENGIYSHQPHDPDFVLKNRFGDCKDKSLLLVSALNKIGIKAYPVLLNTVLKEHTTDYLPSARSFDHCICAIRHNNAYVYIDPTITLQRGPFYKRATPEYKLYMVLDSTDQEFYKGPMDTESKITFKETFTILDNGDADLESVSKYYGSHADDMRFTFASNSSGDLQQGYKEYYLKYTDEVEVVDSVRASDDTINNVFTLYEHYNLKRFWVAKDGEKEITQNLLPISINERILYVSQAIRKGPLKLYYPVNSRQELIINKAGGWNIKNEHITENNKFFSYDFRSETNGPQLILKYHYFNKVDHIAPEDYKAYKEKTEFLDKNIVFSTVQSTDVLEPAFNWLLLITILVFLGASFFVCFYFYKKRFSYDFIERYDGISGWLGLMAIGVCFTPLVLLFQVIAVLKEDLFTNVHVSLLDSSSTNYDPGRAIYSLLANGFNMFLFVASIFMIFLFFQRKNSFRPYYVFYKCFNVVFLIVDLTLLYHYAALDGTEDSADLRKQTTAVIRVCIQAAIWVPYIWFSERSRHTFTVGNLNEPPLSEINTSSTVVESAN